MKIFFLGWAAQYEKNFINYLSDNYGVEHLESPKGLRRLHRITRILGRPRRSILLGRVYCRMRKFDRTDLLICNEAMVGSRVNPEIIKAFPGKKVLLIRDLVDARFLEKWRADFDAVYSFDREQCARLGISYMDQFIPIGYRKFAVPADSEKATTEPAALFIGREKGRGATLFDLAGMLESCGYRVDFRILADKSTLVKTRYHITSVIDYGELLEATQQADVLVEINQPGQSGFTLRTLEAACYGKKLITNNQSIKASPLYHPNNVLVLGGRETWTAEMFREFICLPLQSVKEETIYRYSPDFMLESLVGRHGVSS